MHRKTKRLTDRQTDRQTEKQTSLLFSLARFVVLIKGISWLSYSFMD